MIQFKKKRSFQSNSSTISNDFFNVIQFVPKCHNWEDFLDFSRMSIPSDGLVFCRRLSWGSSRFFGNYIWLWTILMIVSAIVFLNRRFILPPLILSALWIVICIATFIDGDYDYRNRKKGTKQYIIPLNERIMLLLALSHLILFVLGTLKQTYFVSVFSFTLAVFHSGSRPILLETIKSKSKVVAPDGFIDEIEGEEEITMVFTKSDLPSRTLTNRRKQNKSRVVGTLHDNSPSPLGEKESEIDVLAIPSALKK